LPATETLQKEEKMEKRTAISFLVLVLALILFSPVVSRAAESEVYLTSEPSGAEVYLDGKEIGNTPLTVQVEGVEITHRLELRKEGSQSTVKTLYNDCPGFTAVWFPATVAPEGYGEILEDATLHIVLKNK
jgi:hypothetical protein